MELTRRILTEPYITALDKMEREWENMNLNIHPYRETGTGVIKGEIHIYMFIRPFHLEMSMSYRGG